MGDSDSSPVLSVVVATRNDDHGGNLHRRMQTFIDALIAQTERHQLDSELIITEWNPPGDRPRVAEAFVWPRRSGRCKIRIIEVPPHIHQRYRWSDYLPLFQMIAKNVGIRRAQGRSVLCTNIDLLFSDELMRFLASGRLDPRSLYRIDRVDVPADVPVGVSVGDQLEYCRRNVLRVNTRWGTFSRNKRIPDRLWKLESVIARGLRAIRKRIFALRRWGRLGRQRPRVPQPRRDSLNMAAFIGRFGSTSRQIHESFVSHPMRWHLRPLHTNACGDFTLLAKEWWLRLRGYPEVEMFSIHLDSVFCNAAHRAGVREVVLHGEMCAYHIEHGSGWSPKEEDRLEERMRAIGVPMLDRSAYRSWIARMKHDPSALIVNAEDWGLGLEPLVETDPIAQNSQWRKGAVVDHAPNGRLM